MLRSPAPAMQLRTYQAQAIRNCMSAWRGGARGVCLVSPTGSGKTVMGTEVVRLALRAGRAVRWTAHRTELVAQAAETMRKLLGVTPTVIAPGYPGATLTSDPRLVVTSVQTMLAGSRDVPPCDLNVLDECHHYAADLWSQATAGGRVLLGLTATPERGDGASLAGSFQEMVVAASYSELIAGGHIVPCRVLRPGEALSQAVAQTPLQAYQRYTAGKQAFVFCPSVDLAKEWAADWSAAGVPAACIEANTPAAERKQMLAEFRSGRLKALHNVYVLTEGVDVPAAEVCVLARGVGHVSTYLQMVGRILRPAEGKACGTLLDLAGVSHDHGLPTEDRVYSLGEGIKRGPAGPGQLKVCMRCGMTFPPKPVCPGCGDRPVAEVVRPQIYDLELAEVYDGEDTPQVAKDGELERLLRKSVDRGWSLSFVAREYEKLFGRKPNLLATTSREQRKSEHRKLLDRARDRGYSPGWAAHRFKALFGVWPERI